MKCPICQKPSELPFKPFCSKGCQNRDLNKWFSGSYAVPAVELDDVDTEALEQVRTGEESPES